jgi:hypothetical protein
MTVNRADLQRTADDKADECTDVLQTTVQYTSCADVLA